MTPEWVHTWAWFAVGCVGQQLGGSTTGIALQAIAVGVLRKRRRWKLHEPNET